MPCRNLDFDTERADVLVSIQPAAPQPSTSSPPGRCVPSQHARHTPTLIHSLPLVGRKDIKDDEEAEGEEHGDDEFEQRFPKDDKIHPQIPYIATLLWGCVQVCDFLKLQSILTVL